MKTAITILLIPGLFVLDLWLAFLTGRWWDDLLGGAPDAGGMVGFFAFCVYGASLGWFLFYTHYSIGNKK